MKKLRLDEKLQWGNNGFHDAKWQPQQLQATVWNTKRVFWDEEASELLVMQSPWIGVHLLSHIRITKTHVWKWGKRKALTWKGERLKEGLPIKGVFSKVNTSVYVSAHSQKDDIWPKMVNPLGMKKFAGPVDRAFSFFMLKVLYIITLASWEGAAI